MADKKYIGKPGKQDDPCWKGYEMVGMKKKGGRKVPNCVPEATDIIAKAKAKIAEAKKEHYPREGFPEEGDYGYHPNPGMKPQESDSDEDMDKAYKLANEKIAKKPLNAKITEGEDMPWHEDPKNPTRKAGERKDQYGNKVKNVAKHLAKKAMKAYEETELDEALTRATTGNPGYGYHGNVEAKDDAERDKRYSAMHRYTKQLVAPHLQDAKKPNVMVKHFLDSAHGRHIADSPTDKNITSRFAHFKKSYNPAMHEEVEIDEGVTNPEIKKAYDTLLKTPGGSAERKSAIRRYKSLRQNAVKEGVDIDKYADSLIKRDKQNLSKSHVVHAARVAGVDHKKLMTAVQSKVGRIKEEAHDNCGTPDCCGECDTAIEEAYGMWKVDFPKQHAGKAVAAGSVHVKAQNTAHAHKVAAKRVGVDHKVFKSKVTKSSILPEDLELDEAGVRPMGRSFAKYRDAKDTNSNFMNKWDRRYATPNTGSSKADSRKELDSVYQSGVPITKVPTKNATSQTYFKTKFKGKLKEEQIDEVLGKDNEWGRPELRKKFAAMTPGQEGMTADKIPSFDPRYDDVTTQYCGGIREGYLAEISAKGAEARAKFQAKVQKVLNDPARISKAKKALAKKAKIEKEKEPPHLVMQLRKAVSIGSKVHFQDGKHHTIAPNHADVFMHKYNSAKSSIEKEALQKRAHKSHSEFMKVIAEEVETPQGNGPEYDTHKGNGGHIGTVEASHEDMRFGDVDSEELYAELEKDVETLGWEDIVDLYDPEEIEYEDDEEEDDDEECGCGEMSEAITPAGRLKKKFNAMRTKSRRMMARNIAIKRVSTPEKIKARSVRTARRMVYKRLLRNRDISTVSAAEKTRIEAQIKRMAPMVARLSVRVMPQVRKLEQSRIKNSRTRKKK